MDTAIDAAIDGAAARLPIRFGFDNSYRRLPARFYACLEPTPVAAPALVAVNDDLARCLGLDLAAIPAATAAAIFAGNRLPVDAEPIATAYAGHQFGSFVPQLGDGRAILLGELIDATGRRHDLQLKGSGRTPFSRRGDGRAALGPVLREYLVSEAMHALGVPTTRALAAVTTGEPVIRDQVLPGAVLTRVASSHIRVGTFQYFAVRGDTEAVRLLADHVIARHEPGLAGDPQPYLGLLAAIAGRQARLVARWMQIGFIHGVMNTDNMAVAGETIDYGPCAFVDAYDPAAVFSAIDQGGRYAFANQPRIAAWNLCRLAETLLPLIDPAADAAVAQATAVLEGYGAEYERAWLEGMRAKLGLSEAEADDRPLIDALLAAMHRGGADFTLTFRRLADVAATAPAGATAAAVAAEPLQGVRRLFAATADIDAWIDRWLRRIGGERLPPSARAAAMRAVNPAFIPRNHRLERALQAAIDGDLGPFEALRRVLSQPFADEAASPDDARPPMPAERVCQTFCGT